MKSVIPKWLSILNVKEFDDILVIQGRQDVCFPTHLWEDKSP